jgi:pantoate--beta-alanine ligase
VISVVATVDEVRAATRSARDRNLVVGLVPTMGALHAGHVSLIRAARREVGYVVASIFVNPAQFGPKEDLSRYPRPLTADLELCRNEGVDLAFVPEASTVYPPGFCTYVEVQGLQDVLCGASRPGHFRGVATVVLKLFNIVQPDIAYFGQKDAQQARIIGQMVRDLNVPVQLRVCPIVREADGLALSSRNVYLDPAQRRHAVELSRSLQDAVKMVETGQRDARALRETLLQRLNAIAGAVVDYLEIVDTDSLQPVANIDRPALIALAVKFGATRLIDNIVVTPRGA